MKTSATHPFNGLLHEISRAILHPHQHHNRNPASRRCRLELELKEGLRLGSLVRAAIAALALFSTAYAEDAGTHLFILSGQSNMHRLDPTISFTPTIEAAFGKGNVIVVKHAQGGQPIRRWYKQWKPLGGEVPEKAGDLYDALMAKVKQATKGRTIATIAFVWVQGEKDAREGHGEVYAESLRGLFAQLRNDMGRQDIAFVVGRLSDHDLNNCNHPHWTLVREAQMQVADTEPKTVWVDADDLNDGVDEKGKPIKGDLHYSVEGYRIFGERLAAACIKLTSEDETR